jgi:hypothetical protein
MKMMISTIVATMLKGNGTVYNGINSSFGIQIDKCENVDGHRHCDEFAMQGLWVQDLDQIGLRVGGAEWS